METIYKWRKKITNKWAVQLVSMSQCCVSQQSGYDFFVNFPKRSKKRYIRPKKLTVKQKMLFNHKTLWFCGARKNRNGSLKVRKKRLSKSWTRRENVTKLKKKQAASGKNVTGLWRKTLTLITSYGGPQLVLEVKDVFSLYRAHGFK